MSVAPPPHCVFTMPDTLVRVFEHLDPEAILATAGVCKLWRQIGPIRTGPTSNDETQLALRFAGNLAIGPPGTTHFLLCRLLDAYRRGPQGAPLISRLFICCLMPAKGLYGQTAGDLFYNSPPRAAWAAKLILKRFGDCVRPEDAPWIDTYVMKRRLAEDTLDDASRRAANQNSSPASSFHCAVWRAAKRNSHPLAGCFHYAVWRGDKGLCRWLVRCAGVRLADVVYCHVVRADADEQPVVLVEPLVAALALRPPMFGVLHELFSRPVPICSRLEAELAGRLVCGRERTIGATLRAHSARVRPSDLGLRAPECNLDHLKL